MSPVYQLLFIQALATIFLAGGITFGEKNLKSLSLGLFMLLFGFEIFYFIYGTTFLQRQFPDLVFRFYFSVGLIYGPLLFVHFQAQLHEKKHLILKDALHLVPLVVMNLLIVEVLVLPAEDRLSYLKDAQNFDQKIMPLNYFRALHQLCYAFALVYMANAIKGKKSSSTVNYVIGVAVIFLISILVIAYFTLFASGWSDFKWYYFLNNLLLLVIIYMLYTNPNFFQNLKKKYRSSSLQKEDMEHILNKMTVLFESDEVYLNPDLSKKYLAELLGVKPHHISQTFSDLLDMHMNDFVNKYRIAYAKKLLTDKAYDQFTIEAIALDCGFNNKVTFYKAFSKFEHETPSQFKKRISKK